MRRLAFPAAALLLASCAHRPLSGADLDRVQRPAFVSWIQNGAGPRSEVFQSDSSYRARLKKMDDKEADRRLTTKLQRGVTRFEVSDRLRAGTLLTLPREAPWTNVVDAGKVASLFGSFLVEEVPSAPPDLQELKQLGVDAVVEFVIHSYGLRSAKGKAGAFVEGEARMIFLDGGEVWRMPFSVDQVKEKTASLDPFQVSKDETRTLFRDQLSTVLDQVSAAAAKELQPVRAARPAAGPGTGASTGPGTGTGAESPKPGQTGDQAPPPEQKDDLPPNGELE